MRGAVRRAHRSSFQKRFCWIPLNSSSSSPQSPDSGLQSAAPVPSACGCQNVFEFADVPLDGYLAGLDDGLEAERLPLSVLAGLGFTHPILLDVESEKKQGRSSRFFYPCGFPVAVRIPTVERLPQLFIEHFRPHL